MDALCPKCKKTGVNKETGETCEQCNGSGYMTVGFAQGRLFTRQCLNRECEFENGGYILEDAALPEPPESPRTCIVCDHECRWKELGTTEDLGLT